MSGEDVPGIKGVWSTSLLDCQRDIIFLAGLTEKTRAGFRSPPSQVLASNFTHIYILLYIVYIVCLSNGFQGFFSNLVIYQYMYPW